MPRIHEEAAEIRPKNSAYNCLSSSRSVASNSEFRGQKKYNKASSRKFACQ